MAGRDLHAFLARAVQSLGEAGQAAAAEADAEAALRQLTLACFELLGDREAHLRDGALKDDERQFFVAGVFLVTPAADGHILVAEHGFPAEQHRLSFPIDTAHPGWVYQHRKPLILANTDDHAEFKQILKTARMGSALYAPLLWRDEMLGQMVMAAQARNTFSAIDLDVLLAFAQLATAHYLLHDGPALLATLVRGDGA